MKLEGEALEYFLICCKEVGIKVTTGTGKVTMNGEKINVKEVLDAAYPGKPKEYNLYQSLKRGLEEAIAHENGEVECMTETREDGDA